MNLFNAVALAASPDGASASGALVTMNDAIHAARDVTKLRTASPDAFDTPGVRAAGTHAAGRRRTSSGGRCAGSPVASSAFDLRAIESLPRVDIAYGHAGATRVAVDAFVAAGARGIVHAGVGQGDVAPDVLEGLKARARAGRARRARVARAGRHGGANGALDDDALDFVAADTLNPQKARVLLMLALGVTDERREIQALFDAY